jgi:general secretion pathway protein A
MMESTLPLHHSDYLDHLGLKTHPFPVAPDLNHFFLSDTVEEILAEIVHGIEARKGFMLLTGDVGVGKTTISRRLLAMLEQKKVATSLVFNTVCQKEQLLEEINRDFGIPGGNPRLNIQFRKLNHFLLAKNRKGVNCAILIDDAQNLSPASLEMIRQISNLEANGHKLAQILLIGQPELLLTLSMPGLRQLNSRVVIRKKLFPLDSDTVKDYLRFKLIRAGDSGRTRVSPAAMRRISALTRGNLRLLNILMDRCLYAAYLHQTSLIDRQLVRQVWADLALSPEKRTPRFWRLSLLAASLLLLVGIWGMWPGPQQHGTAVRFPIIPEAVASSSVVPGETALQRAPSPPFVQASAVQQGPASTAGRKEESGKLENVISAGETARFLRHYGLERYQQQLRKALSEDRLADLSATLANREGMELIILDTMTAATRGREGVLEIRSAGGDTTRFLLVWRPPLVVEHFYYGYHGPEILKTQQLMARLGFYRGELDGTVGRNLLRGLVAFQRSLALAVTGLPDRQTLFHLCRLAGQEVLES